MVRVLYAAIALLVIQCWPAGADDLNCMNFYYRAKPPACLDSLLSQLREKAPPQKFNPAETIGFLAQLFSKSPAERQRILDNGSSDYVGSVELTALYRAGLHDDARKFADNNHLSAVLQNLETTRPAPLAEVRPSSVSADNDFLIGAYMASGETVFIERILENFSSADDGMVSDGLRMGAMRSKFGPTLVPKERESVTFEAACAKYQCKTDPVKHDRLRTLSIAFWALQTLSRYDDGIKKTLAGFFDHDPRLKNLLFGEQAAYGHYAAATAMLTALKPDQISAEGGQMYETMSKVASAYEHLEPTADAFAQIEALAKSGKKLN
jgi:hypothetical protein